MSRLVSIQDERRLIEHARSAREKSYCPYSGKSVGAALLCAGGAIYSGANIENAAFSPTICAERVAINTAVYAGERDFHAIAIAGGERGKPPEGFMPCGVCRQVMSEFTGGDLIILVCRGDEYDRYTLGELFPAAFNISK